MPRGHHLLRHDGDVAGVDADPRRRRHRAAGVDRRHRASARRGQGRRPGDGPDGAAWRDGRVLHPRLQRDARLLERPREDERGSRRGGLDAHRRPRDDGQRRLPQHRRSDQGHGHPRRRERLPARDRGVPLLTSRDHRRPGGRRSRRQVRRGAVRVDPRAGRRKRQRGRRARLLPRQARTLQSAALCPRRRRVPDDGHRQDPEVQDARSDDRAPRSAERGCYPHGLTASTPSRPKHTKRRISPYADDVTRISSGAGSLRGRGGIMRRLVRGVAAATLAAGVVLAAPAAPALATGGSISGTVTLASGGPAFDVCVHARPWFGGTMASTTTAADGSYHLAVSDGSYRVEFFDCHPMDDLVTGWDPDKVDINDGTTLTVSGSALTGIDEHMVQGGRIAGQVLDGQGAPIADADVMLQLPSSQGWDGLEDARTGPDGRYTLFGVAPGSWRLRADLSPTYARTFSGDTDDFHVATLYDVTARTTTTGADIHLGRAATVTGTVVDERGQPRAGVCVTAWGSSESTDLAGAQTGSDGTYTLTGVYPGTVRVSVSACQGPYVWYANGDSYIHATPFGAAEGATVTGVDVTLPHGPVIAGTVTDTAGNPVPYASISLYDGITGSSLSSTPGGSTDANGHYMLTGLSSKLYLVEAQPPSSSDLTQRFWPAALSRTTAVPIAATVATTDIDLTLPVGGSIAGHVTAASTGAALSVICVMARNSDPDLVKQATTSSDGSYLIRGLSDGDYDVEYTDCNHRYDVAPSFWKGSDLYGSGTAVTVTSGQNVSGVDQSMLQGASMHGRVVDTGAGGIAGICMYISTPEASASYGSAITDSDGVWRATGLAPDRAFGVYAHACDSSAPWVPKQLPADYSTSAGGDTHVPDIVLHHGGSFTGTVTDQYGHPVAETCVASMPSDPSGTTVYFRTTINGTYVAGGLEPGTYSALFADCGVGMMQTYWKSPAYETRATFTVTSDHTTTGIDQTVILFELPSAPTDVTVLPGDDDATLSWQPPTTSGHTDITGYAVTGPAGTTVLGPRTRSHTFTGLRNGSSYRLSVAAVNVKGIGRARTVATTLSPVHSVTISGPRSTVSGTTVRLSGHGVLADGSAAAARAVAIYRRPAGSARAWRLLARTQTGAGGSWHLDVAPARPTSYRVSMQGVGARYTQHVAARLSAVGAHRLLTLRSAPSRPGAVVVVQRRSADGTWAFWTRGRLDAYDRLRLMLPAGRWRGCLPATKYWSPSCSPVAVVSCPRPAARRRTSAEGAGRNLEE